MDAEIYERAAWLIENCEQSSCVAALLMAGGLCNYQHVEVLERVFGSPKCWKEIIGMDVRERQPISAMMLYFAAAMARTGDL